MSRRALLRAVKDWIHPPADVPTGELLRDERSAEADARAAMDSMRAQRRAIDCRAGGSMADLVRLGDDVVALDRQMRNIFHGNGG